jgi:putative restriction endonuclease
MRLFVAITDSDWFSYLSTSAPPDEVNFWQPSGNVRFRALQPGEPFLFKLHRPNDFIVGGGFFSHSTILPVSLAWESFDIKNGAHTEQEMRTRVEHYRRVPPSPIEDYEVGCVLLQAPFFFRREDWIAVPDWSRNIVRGKGFESEVEPGKSLWTRVQALLAESSLTRETVPEFALDAKSRFGTPQTILPRLGQGLFRVMVTDAYQRHCAVTRSPILYVLEAAHIRPYQSGGPHSLSNGILLRKDIHTLFDRGYLTVTPQHKIEVSKRIKQEFHNGKEYYALHGSDILLPADRQSYPGSEYLTWHNESAYRD